VSTLVFRIYACSEKAQHALKNLTFKCDFSILVKKLKKLKKAKKQEKAWEKLENVQSCLYSARGTGGRTPLAHSTGRSMINLPIQWVRVPFLGT
jgi:hypothetical protein